MTARRYISAKQLATLLFFCNGNQVAARPKPQDDQPTSASGSQLPSVAPVTSIATTDGSEIAATFTPTSIAISGLEPPITAATTVTTTDSEGKTVAIGVAAGAGVVAGVALAAWLFKPVPGAPGPPTSPPSYPTSTQDDEPRRTSTDQFSTTSAQPTSSSAAACPLESAEPVPSFAIASEQPQWTAQIPSQTTSLTIPECTSGNDNGQLYHNLPPDMLNELADVFCDSDLSQDVEKTLGKDDLPDDSSWNRDDAPVDKAKFSFELGSNNDGCADNCKKAFDRIVRRCQDNHNYLYGGGSVAQGCGTYGIEVEGDPITKLTCTGPGENPLKNYLDRDVALEAIENFCGAQDGKIIKQGDSGSFLDELTFSVRYAEDCAGSGTYTVKKDLCIDYLGQTLDNCDTDTGLYKHGGALQDLDNCGLFESHPTSFNEVLCYPDNQDYIPGGSHVPVTQAMATDAINTFCDRSGNGQQYTLDAEVQQSEGSFTQDTCTEEGTAACGYFYKNDGTKVTEEGEVGDLIIRMEATHFEGEACGPPLEYEIHGDRCKEMLGIFTGAEPIQQCTDGGPEKLDLGTVFEGGDMGCVKWTMWAVATHG